VAGLLVLWDVDHTLINAGGTSPELYRTVFAELFSRELPSVAPMAGRTDRAIILETLTAAGIPDPRIRVDDFVAGLAAHSADFAAEVRARGQVLPGAAEALAALAALAEPLRPAEPAHTDLACTEPARAEPARTEPLTVTNAGAAPSHDHGGPVRQSVLTGNIRPLAHAKLRALGLISYLDMDIGAYGDDHESRAELVHIARRNAARAQVGSPGRSGDDGAGPGQAGPFTGTATVLVGDTPLDVQAALVTGARAVGIATGGFTADELAAAGAHLVLTDLADTARVLEAILGPAGRSAPTAR
jgi:phosphoglycolate phosphatase-like HAD superfamily hydrolase